MLNGQRNQPKICKFLRFRFRAYIVYTIVDFLLTGIYPTLNIYIYRPVARLGIEGGRDISQVGPDMFVTLSKCFSNIF